MWGGVAIFVALALTWCFSREAEYTASNQTMPIKQVKKKLASGLVIQIIPPKVLHECSTILQLKVYIIYVVQKLVGYSSQSVLSIWLYSFFHLSAMQDLWTISVFYFFSHKVSHHKVRKAMNPSFWKKLQIDLAWRAKRVSK